ncbi:Uncharacterised protein [Vibrio cholerae]|nr:Uncharacterised protein [Vibrio cholerae]CSC79533.1 Uncharacterised protein [Vibrio cholerae]
MSSKQRHGTNLFGKPLGTRPSERESVISTGTAANLIHQHQTVTGRIVQNIGGFRHLHHKG